MGVQSGREICCESMSISSVSGAPNNALFFHRFPDENGSFENAYLPKCSIHNDVVASLQCIDCVKKGLPVIYSYHCSKKCFLDAWKAHSWYHRYANEDTEGPRKLRRCDSWPPADTVSWFDAKLEVVIPTGSEWVSNSGPSNALIPLADGAGFSFKLESAQAFVTDPVIQRSNLLPRSIMWLPDQKKPEKFGLSENFSKIGNLKVLTYNILSQFCVNTDIYWYCPQWALSWEYRRKNLLHEMISYNADILCLQEVQSDHFENFFKPQLEAFGYSVVYKRKNVGVYTSKGDQFDGCATFFRNNKFKEVISYELEYSKSAFSLMEKLDPSLIQEARKRLFKDNVAVIVVLEMVDIAVESAASFSRLCVVNTHICADKNFPDVKLFQVSELISEVEKIIGQRMPLFICGDMNSRPGSDPYVLLTKHEVDPGCAEADDPLCIYQHLKLKHSMKLASAYASAFPKLVNDGEGWMTMMDPETGEPPFTRLTPIRGYVDRKTGEFHFTPLLEIRSTLDYIFYTEDSLEVEGLLELPDHRSVGRALPSHVLSSDHIALMGSFRITRPFLK